MSEIKAGWWEERANQGIVGLGPDDDHWVGWWPSHGFDGELHEYNTGEYVNGVHVPEPDPFKQSGHTKAEWLELADAMLARWQAWKAHVETLPEDR